MVERLGLVISSIFPSRSIKSKISCATCEKDVDVKNQEEVLEEKII